MYTYIYIYVYIYIYTCVIVHIMYTYVHMHVVCTHRHTEHSTGSCFSLWFNASGLNAWLLFCRLYVWVALA